MNVILRDDHSTMVEPRQPRWDCFGFFRRNNVIIPDDSRFATPTLEAVAQRRNDIELLTKDDVKNKLSIAELNYDTYKKMNKRNFIPVKKIETNIELLKKQEARLTSTISSVAREDDVVQKTNKLWYLTKKRLFGR